MKKKILSTLLSAAMLASSCAGLMPTAFAAANTPTYQAKARQMEKLNRGLIAVKTTADTRGQTVTGVYLSWRLLGDESLENQAFDIYRDGAKIHTTGPHDATCYVDTYGSVTNKYKVVKKGESAANEPEVTPIADNYYAKPSEVGNGYSEKNSFTYVDVPIVMPADVARMGDGKTSTYARTRYDGANIGGANDASVGDLDGDGDYEIVLKWDPQDSKDSAGADFTGNVYIDAYEIDPNNGGYMWRIDLGQNVTAGAHYTQFMVYDFDGDGKSEIAMKTAPGSKDGQGNYVSEVGDTDAIRNVDNTAVFIGTSGRTKGKNPFTQYLTIFDGETGAALYTTEYIPYEAAKDKYWGDGSAKYNRSERYLAGVAYLDGVHPSIIMCRGYYNDAIVRAYNWDGNELTMLWEHNGSSKGATSLYGQGNHNLSIADIDNDGKDEIVYGSAALDDNGVAMGNTYLGHGDAMHVNDFNNDGVQEVFSVKEDKEGYANNAASFRVAGTGKILWGKGASGDTGRGVMANIDDTYAASNPNGLALGWSSSHANLFDLAGNEIAAKPSAGSRSMDNFLVWWDGDLGRELLDDNIIGKYHVANGGMTRFYGPSDGYSLSGSSNNHSKRNPSLVADIWGDWREEIIMPVNDGDATAPALRIFTSTLPTEYRLTTLMHDSQYRMAVAWQNVAYNQPTHTSYYVGSAALATDANGNKLNYLAPAVPYTKVTYEAPEAVAVTGVSLSQDKVTVEKGETVTISAVVEPDEATKKSVKWTSSDPSVATVTAGSIKGISEGTATITVTTNDGGFTASCEVTVFANPATGVTVSEQLMDLGIAYTKKLSAYVYPAEASDTSVTWTSSDNSVATVAADGTVTGVGYGKAIITATTNDGGFTDTCIVRVKPYEVINMDTEDSFVSTTNTDDFKGSATGGSLTLKDSTNATSEFHKDYEVKTDGKVTLKYHYTTGGVKIDGSNWNWDGHEYSFAVKLLDEEGNNLLNLSQAYKSKGETLMSQFGSNAAVGLVNSWNKIIDESGNVQGSAKRWIVTVELDYDNDVANVTLAGTDASFEAETAKYTTSFALGGQKFKTLQCVITKDGTGTVTASPILQDVVYTATTAATGTAETIYEETTQTEESIAGWTQSGSDTAALAFDSANNRIWYNAAEPGTDYSATKTFDLDGDALITYDVDWYFGSSVGRDGNFEYLQFGNNMRIGWTNGYLTWVSTDGGATWNDNDGDSVSDSIFTGSNTTFEKNVQIVFDTAANTIKSFKFDGTVIDAYTNYVMPEGTTYDAVSFGFQRAGKAPTWEVPNGIDSLKVTAFVYGEEPIEISYANVVEVNGSEVAVEYAIGGMTDDEVPLTLIAAAYDENGALVEVQVKDTAAPSRGTEYTDTITFNKDVSNNTVKLFMWDSLNGMVPLCD